MTGRVIAGAAAGIVGMSMSLAASTWWQLGVAALVGGLGLLVIAAAP